MMASEPKRPSGCLAVMGWFSFLAGLLSIAFAVVFWIADERAWEARRNQLQADIIAWEADSAHNIAQVLHFDSLHTKAVNEGNEQLAAAYSDSLARYGEPRRGLCGFPLGGVVSIVVILAALIPLAIGVILLVIYYSRRSKHRHWETWRRKQAHIPPPPPPLP